MQNKTNKLPNGFIETIYNRLVDKKRVVLLDDNSPIVKTNVVLKREKQNPKFYQGQRQKGNSFNDRLKSKNEERFRENTYDEQVKTNSLLLQLLTSLPESIRSSKSNSGGFGIGGLAAKGMKGMLGGAGKLIGKTVKMLGFGVIGKLGKLLLSVLSPMKFLKLGVLLFAMFSEDIGKFFNGIKDEWNKRSDEYKKYQDDMGKESHGALSSMLGVTASLFSDLTSWLSDVTNGFIPETSKEDAFAFASKMEKNIVDGYNAFLDYVNLPQDKRDAINASIQKKVDIWWDNISDFVSRRWDSLLEFTGMDEKGREDKTKAISDKIEDWWEDIDKYFSDLIDDLLSDLSNAVSKAVDSIASPISDTVDSVKEQIFGKDKTRAEEIQDDISSTLEDLDIVNSDNWKDKASAMFLDSREELESRLASLGEEYNELAKEVKKDVSKIRDNISLDKKRLYKDLKRDEGEKLEVYKDTEDKLTVGVGHLLAINGGDVEAELAVIGRKLKRGDKITKEQSEGLFQYDINKHIAEFFKLHPWVKDAPEQVQRSLVNMSFNMGEHFMNDNGKFAKTLKAGKYKEAFAQTESWKWSSQVGDRADRVRNRATDNIDMVMYARAENDNAAQDPTPSPTSQGQDTQAIRDLIAQLKNNNGVQPSSNTDIKVGGNKIEFVDDIGNSAKV
jgi:GH24 family phage-related lysozyme (muramidase)